MSRYYRDPVTGEEILIAGTPTTAKIIEVAESSDVDTANNTTAFTSSDTTDADANIWTSVTKLSSGEDHKSIFAKMSQMFKNVRYLYKMLGTTDISSIGDGTVTGGLDTLNSDLSSKIIVEPVILNFDAEGITYLARKEGYVLIGASINATTQWVLNTIGTLWNLNGYITYGLICKYKNGSAYANMTGVRAFLTWVKIN